MTCDRYDTVESTKNYNPIEYRKKNKRNVFECDVGVKTHTPRSYRLEQDCHHSKFVVSKIHILEVFELDLKHLFLECLFISLLFFTMW